MRMMTGAILILAHALLYSVYVLGQLAPEGSDLDWLQWYAWCLGGIGLAFLVWGFIRDLSASTWRKHQRHKGDT